MAAFRFELGKVVDKDIRARTVTELNRVDHELAGRVAVYTHRDVRQLLAQLAG